MASVNPRSHLLDYVLKGVQVAADVYGVKQKEDQLALDKDKAEKDQAYKKSALQAAAERTSALRDATSQDKAASRALTQAQLDETRRHNQAMETNAAKGLDLKGSKSAELAQNGKPLSPADIEKYGGGRDAFKQLDALDKTLAKHGELLGPFEGRARSLNPYDSEAQSVQSSVDAARQVIGKFLEGGVLRKEDEAKYAKILPTLADTPQTAREKLSLVKELVQRKQNDNVASLKQQGYDVRGIDLAEIKLPGLEKRQGQGIGEANAAPAGTPAFSAAEIEAELERRTGGR